MESDQKILEPELEIMSNEVYSPTTSDQNDFIELVSESSSQSSSDDNELINEEKASPSSSTSSSDNEHGEKTKMGIDYTIESPPIQAMDRLSPNPTTKKYRIRSSVFNRKESIDTGWGIPSNESLFSIHTGMSFRNRDSLVWRSGELDLGFGFEPSPSSKFEDVKTGPKFDEMGQNHEFSDEFRNRKLGEEDKIQSFSEMSNNHGSNVVNQPVNLNLEDNQGNESVVEEHNSHLAADGGDTFPILTAERPSARTTSSAKTESEPQLETQHEPEKQSQPSEPTPAATWTNCFGCCTFCC